MRRRAWAARRRRRRRESLSPLLGGGWRTTTAPPPAPAPPRLRRSSSRSFCERAFSGVRKLRIPSTSAGLADYSSSSSSGRREEKKKARDPQVGSGGSADLPFALGVSAFIIIAGDGYGSVRRASARAQPNPPMVFSVPVVRRPVRVLGNRRTRSPTPAVARGRAFFSFLGCWRPPSSFTLSGGRWP